MKYFFVEPEVAGGLGNHTEMDRNIHPPLVVKLHYEFSGWLGDVLLESFPCFIVTTDAKRALLEFGVSGVRFDDVEVTVSEQFAEIARVKQLPQFFWLKVDGEAYRDDFGLAADGRLVVSEHGLDILKGLGISNALIRERLVAG